MKNRRWKMGVWRWGAICYLLSAISLSAQTHTMPGSNVVPSGASLTINSGASITAAAGSTVRMVRVSTSATGNTTPTPNADTDDQYNCTGMTANMVFGAPTGTPVAGQKLIIRIKDSGSARTLGWNAIYRVIGTTLPTTTTANKTIYVGIFYNATDTKWDVLAVGVEL